MPSQQAQPRPAADADAAPPVGERVAIVTLGCGRNEVDSDQLAGLFHREGWDVVDDPGTADAVLVNTCTFIEPAKQESIDTVLAACELKEGRARGVVVTGCMAQRYPDELAEEIPEADAVVGFAGYPRLPGLVGDILAGRDHERVIAEQDEHPASNRSLDGDDGARTALPLLMTPMEAPPEASSPAETDRPTTPQDDLDRMPATGPRFPVRAYGDGDGPDRPWAYLKIASGCDRMCTFCAIPSFRGGFRSRPLDEIVTEARWLVDRGARELVLVSENTTSWGKDLEAPDGGGRALQPRLLEQLADVDGLRRIRLMYLQPSELQRPLVEAMAGLDEVCSYFDLSLQHVSGRLLQHMARGGDAETFRRLIADIRGLDPDAVFRSNFILGFPGETEEEVRLLEEFLEDVRLDWVGLFPFSREDGTPSADYGDQVPEDVARDRVERVSRRQEHLADRAAMEFVGRRLEVTVEESPDDGPEALAACVGRSYREAPETDGEVRLVTPHGDPVDLPVGRTVTAEIVESVGVDLVGRVDPSWA